MNSEDEQVYSVYCNFLVILSTTVCRQNLNKQIINIASTKILRITAFSVGIPILNQRVIYEDDIEFVTEFPCLLGRMQPLQYFEPSFAWKLNFF